MRRWILGLASLVVVVLMWLALDDLTTGSEPHHALERTTIAVGTAWFLGLAVVTWRRARR